MAYNTGNAIGSADARDLYDNAQNLDKAMNSTAPTWIDRFGVARPTFKGAESELNQKVDDAEAAATQALGYLNTMRATSYGPLAEDPATDPLGNPCTAGDEYFNTTYNLLKRYDGENWRVPDINTTNLASGAGSSMVGHGGQTVEAALNERILEVGNYAALDAYTGDATSVLVYGVSNIFDGGAGVFRRTTDTPAAANGIYRQDALGRWWKRDFGDKVNVRWWGAVEDTVITSTIDNAPAINAAIAFAGNVYQIEIDGSFPCADKIWLIKGTQLIGRNGAMPDKRTTNRGMCRLIFTSTDPAKVGVDVDISVRESDYVWGVRVSGVFLHGRSVVGSVGLNSRYLGNAVISNVGIAWFDIGLNVVYGITNAYERVNSQACLTAALFMSDEYSITTTQTFIGCVFRESPWGAIISTANGNYQLGTVFENCKWESCTVGGMNVHRGCDVAVIEPYFENVPVQASTPDGTAIRLYFEGATTHDIYNVCRISGGQVSGPNAGSFLGNTLVDVDYGCAVNIDGTLLQRATYGVRASANTKDGAICFGRPSFNSVTNLTSGSADKFQGMIPSAVLSNPPTYNQKVRRVQTSLVEFPATKLSSADPHTLDFYEEGTWSPAVAFGGLSTGVAYSEQYGFYTIVGNRCKFNLRVVLSSKGSAVGAATISLPFASENVTGNQSAFSLQLSQMTAGVGDTMLVCANPANSASIIPRKMASGSVVQLADTDFTNTSSIVISGEYLVG